jgi:hypothetical protein
LENGEKMLGNSEHIEQVNFFYWSWLNRAKHPAFELIFAIPNGGARHPAVARKLKDEGVKSGVPDIFIPWPMPEKRLFGMWIEMKSEKGRVSDTQNWWMEKLKSVGYHHVVCRSWQDAATCACEYLDLKLDLKKARW